MKLFISISMLVALSCEAQTLPFHPYRKAGDTYYDLRPLYAWVSKRTGPRPMTGWIGPGTIFVDRYGLGREKLEKAPVFDPHFIVISVSSDGLLLEVDRMANGSGSMPDGSPRLIFLKNYPGWTEFTDGESIKFIALAVGNYQYHSSNNSLRTVPLYDYGTPYDPNKLLAERNRTNAPATKPK